MTSVNSRRAAFWPTSLAEMILKCDVRAKHVWSPENPGRDTHLPRPPSPALPPPPGSHLLTCAPTQLCVTPFQGQPVGPGAGAWGCGGGGAGQALPRHFHCRPQQVDLLAVDVLHVVLGAMWEDRCTVMRTRPSPAPRLWQGTLGAWVSPHVLPRVGWNTRGSSHSKKRDCETHRVSPSLG